MRSSDELQEEMLAPRKVRTFRPDIEGLRAVAVVLVVLYHAGVPRIKSGYIGVDVFFVISGYLITGLLIHEFEDHGKISLLGFYARRTRRILPAAMSVVILVVLAAYHYQNFITYGLTAQDARWAALFAANFHYAIAGSNYFAQVQAPSPLLHFWSLAVEEQFYVVWPTLLMLVGIAFRRSLRTAIATAAIAISAASFMWAIIEVSSNTTWAYYSPLSRAWELGLGAVVAALSTQTKKMRNEFGVGLAFAGLTAIVLSAFVFNASTAFPGIPAMLPVFGAVAVIIGGESGSGAGMVLGLRPVRSVGRVSYGWYLLHYPPMILLAGVLWRGPLPVHERLLIAAVTLVAAYVLYALLENPIRRSKALISRPWLSIAVGGGFVLAAFLVGALLHKSL